MTTRNFRVKEGISVGDITISASANTITGLTTSAPVGDGDVANKKYVDDQINAISSTAISDGNSDVTVSDSGTGTITVNADGGAVASFAAANTTITASNNINLTATGDVVIPANVGVTFGTGEKIEGDNTDLTVTSGGKINLTATSDVQIPADVGVLFGTGGEKIESDGTDLTITSTGALQLTVTGTTTVSGALTVTGDLTVNGTTTTVNSTNTTLDDNLLELNSGAASNANDSGFIIERGSTGDNAIFMWDESADKFTLGTTTATASDTGDLSITTGTLVAATFEGDLTGDVTGNADTATEATNVTITANNATDETVYLTFVDGATGTQGLETDTGLSYNPSTNVLTTTASQAQYADLAEKYTTDQEYAVGTVVMVNTADASEVTSITSGNIAVGVISGAPAYLMNADSEGQAIALKGRVPVCVNGPVSKGQAVYVDDNGCASASTTDASMVGVALESNDSEGTKLVECILKV